MESDFLEQLDLGADPASLGHQLQVERLWLLAWSISITPTLHWDDYCSEELASWLPDLRTGEDTKRFRNMAGNRRTDTEVLAELDAAYCITWGCAEANLHSNQVPGNVEQYVMWERRAALEWLRGDDWDEPDLST